MKEVFTALTISALHSQIEEFMELHDAYEWDMITIVTEKVYDETAPFLYRWKATLTPEGTIQATKDLLCERGYVHFFVSSEEVMAIATDMQREMNEEELKAVLRSLSMNDMGIGINEEAIQFAISEVCPTATDEEE